MNDTSSEDTKSTTVTFRPRRRCPKCGLVNTDSAPRCRRCQRKFTDLDPRAESERLVGKLERQRSLVIVVTLLVALGLAGIGYAVWQQVSLASHFDELQRALSIDLESAERGALEDAKLVAGAFDDNEIKRQLDDRRETWADRSRRCQALAARVDELVPRNQEQTAEKTAIEKRLAALTRATRALAAAAEAFDTKAAREAASRFVSESGAPD